MKKSITLLSLFLMLATVFVACDKDDDEQSPEEKIIGTWEVSKIVIKEIDNKDVNFELNRSMFLLRDESAMTLKPDGTVLGSINQDEIYWSLEENNKLKIYDLKDGKEDNSRIYNIEPDFKYISWHDTEEFFYNSDNKDYIDDTEFFRISFSEFEKEFNYEIGNIYSLSTGSTYTYMSKK